MPTGPNVWDNNNLGQKNITIVDSRRLQWIEFEFRYGHPQLRDPRLSLEINKVRAPRNLQVYLDLKDVAQIETIAKTNRLPMPKLDLSGGGADGLSPIPGESGPVLTPISPDTPKLPFRVTFLEETKIAVSGSELRAGEDNLIFTFPKGSSVELGHGPLPQIEPVDSETANDGTTPDGNGRAQPNFQIAALEGKPVIAFTPTLKSVKLEIPLLKPGAHMSTFRFQVPKDAVPGESYIFDIAQRNAQGVLVGGVRLQVNIAKE